MDKDSAMLIVAKDLFLDFVKRKGMIVPANIKGDAIMEYFANEFTKFLKKLKSGIDN